MLNRRHNDKFGIQKVYRNSIGISIKFMMNYQTRKRFNREKLIYSFIMNTLIATTLFTLYALHRFKDHQKMSFLSYIEENPNLQKTYENYASCSKLYSNPFPKLKEDKKRKMEIKNAFLFAWNNYKKYSWGHDFLQPISRKGKNVFSGGLSISDSLDTLLIMGLEDEFQIAREWIEKDFKFVGNFSVFEIIIRHVGGFLSTYQMTGDKLFLNRAYQIAERILPLFTKKTGFFRTFGYFTEDGKSIPQGRVECLLSDIGSIQLEFYTLSLLTGDQRFAKKAAKIHKYLFHLYPNDGLYPERVNTESGRPHGFIYSVDSMSDSFYEYLIKLYLMTSGTQTKYLEKYLLTTESIEKRLLQRKPAPDGSNYTYLARIGRNGKILHLMSHLVTFAGGMIAIGTVKNNPRSVEHLNLAAELVETYMKLYRNCSTGFMPEIVNFYNIIPNGTDWKYQLRPETIESIFYMYRLTGLQKYRDFGYEIFQNIEKYCKLQNGYATIKHVNKIPIEHIDIQDSYFLAETLKYLYLLFSSSDVIPLSQYVFNTEAHPLRVWTEEQAKKMMKIINIQ
ncbi:Mannosyl-oligosaccharide 1,2-alpha-mannosidase MNS1 [Tritrichomonas foetus]|uniref:alpha-1,2-Mannosidase n=1 Tax=Tritrichomonas foetus TaxID=1144522 RepID=A0A1J4K9C8_9EUKA|nr:Mannosyl-oligosaccharide 1,2-alpha-mannosidase MNS1 [Tritrichomonas foetus]|eukprot:OHT08081.1 Mannosyl-oligosaccharide 1,2-alpha-mannosidase MNS1 [Tritrichomonas foetus]